MSARIFYPTAEKLKFLIDSIHNREVALPDFQRDFVWDPRSTEELIESISQNYPAGSLLRIKNSAGFYFAPREFTGSPALNGHAPSYLILDGQQRLTSLYQAFYGTGNHRYFINLSGLIDGQDLEDCVFYLRKNQAKERLGKIAQQAESLTFPFENLFGGDLDFDEWLDQILELRPESGDDAKTLKKQLREAKKNWLDPVTDYEFPVVTLSEDTSAAAVCTIFETLNRTGIKLSVFDLLTARFWSNDVRLRDLWQQAQEDYPIISDFEVDPYYILQAIAIYTAPSAPSCKRSDVLKMSIQQINNGWEPIVKGLASFLQMLRSECGVIIPKWLPYNTILVPAAAILAAHQDITGPKVADIRAKVQQWFWCSVFGQVYENAPNSQSAKDYVTFKRWVSDGTVPQSVAEFSFKADTLRHTTPRQRAVYRGVIALILRHGARDFHKAGSITASMMLQQKIEDHHVFPQAFLKASRPDIVPAQRDCILNRTLIDKETNARIGKKAPETYLSDMKDSIGSDYLETLLSSHLLPKSLIAYTEADYETYSEERLALILTELETVTQSR